MRYGTALIDGRRCAVALHRERVVAYPDVDLDDVLYDGVMSLWRRSSEAVTDVGSLTWDAPLRRGALVDPSRGNMPLSALSLPWETVLLDGADAAPAGLALGLGLVIGCEREIAGYVSVVEVADTVRLGPLVVAPDEVPDPRAIRLLATLDGEPVGAVEDPGPDLMTGAVTSMVQLVPPGTVILTGVRAAAGPRPAVGRTVVIDGGSLGTFGFAVAAL